MRFIKCSLISIHASSLFVNVHDYQIDIVLVIKIFKKNLMSNTKRHLIYFLINSSQLVPDHRIALDQI